MSREGNEREAKRRAEWRNYLWVAEAGGIVGSVAHGRRSHSLGTNSQLSVTSSAAQALSATFIIQARPFLGSSAFIFAVRSARTFSRRSETINGRKRRWPVAHPVELRARQAAAATAAATAAGDLRARAEVGHGWALRVAEAGKPLAVVGLVGELLGREWPPPPRG